MCLMTDLTPDQLAEGRRRYSDEGETLFLMWIDDHWHDLLAMAERTAKAEDWIKDAESAIANRDIEIAELKGDIAAIIRKHAPAATHAATPPAGPDDDAAESYRLQYEAAKKMRDACKVRIDAHNKSRWDNNAPDDYDLFESHELDNIDIATVIGQPAKTCTWVKVAAPEAPNGWCWKPGCSGPRHYHTAHTFCGFCGNRIVEKEEKP